MTCTDCGKDTKLPSKCPSCKTVRCFKCWGKHLDDKVCAYGKADKLDVNF